MNIIAEVLQFCKKLFPQAEYAFTTIPTYPSGQIGFILCSKSKKNSLKKPQKKVKKALKKKHRHSLQYYRGALHRAAFVLPKFVKEKI